MRLSRWLGYRGVPLEIWESRYNLWVSWELGGQRVYLKIWGSK